MTSNPLSPRQQAAVDRIAARLLSGEDATEHVGCPCGGEAYDVLADCDRNGIPSPTVVCRRCGLAFVALRPDERALRRFYNEDYFDLYASKSAADMASLYDIQRQQGQAVADFVRRSGVPDPARVFDVGCGTGGMLAAFAERGAAIAGVDYAEQLVAYGNGRLGAGTLETGGVDVLRRRGRADLVIASHLVEHVADPVAWALSLRDVVKPGGHAYILTPGLRTYATRFDGLAPQLLNMHLFYFTLGTLDMVMARAGFSRMSGNQTIEAVYRREADLAGDAAVLRGDPALAGWLRKAELVRPVFRLLWPLYLFISKLKDRTRK